MMKNVIIQTDFGTGSLSVSAMHGVCKMVDNNLNVDDGNNDVNQFDVLDASASLVYLMPYWPEDSVFISVVDPGVGTSRRSCVVKTKTNRYVVTPDNGTLTYIAEEFGIEEVREIDESINRLKGSEDVHIFHGRDVYAYCGARLAAGVISFEEVGPKYPVEEIVMAEYIRPAKTENEVSGMIIEATEHFGLVGTNIPFGWLEENNMHYGDDVEVIVLNKDKEVLHKTIKLVETFGKVEVGEPLVFSSETRTVMLAINRGNATVEYGLGFGPDWKMIVRKI